MKRLVFLFLGTVATAMAQISFLDGTTVELGEPLSAVEAKAKDKALDSDNGRRGVDKKIMTPPAIFEFDSGRLWRVTLLQLQYVAPSLRPFSEEWRNFVPIGERRIKTQMTGVDFDAYLAAWRQQAEAAGKQENVDYWIKEVGSTVMGRQVGITLGPRRRFVGTGKLGGDTWLFSFLPESQSKYFPDLPKGTLKGVIVTGDEFSTRNRGASGSREEFAFPGPANPALAGIVLEDGTQLYFGQRQPEAESLVGRQARALDPRPGAKVLGEPRISLGALDLLFNAERLFGIVYNTVGDVPAPFPEDWKNFTPIGARMITKSTSPEEFDAYLEAWEARAAARGMAKGQHFQISRIVASLGPVVTISLQPSRDPSGGLAAWPDVWRVTFQPFGQPPDRVLRVQSMTAFRGEFSASLLRGAPPLKQEMQDATGALPAIELPKADLVLPKLE
ncbi:MAG: hypothetical protein V4773_27980 [Verrucomicrobiota bacterium]